MPRCISHQTSRQKTIEKMNPKPFAIGNKLTVQAAVDVARNLRNVEIASAAIERTMRAREVVKAALQDTGTAHYGINTGFGALAEVPIDQSQLEQLQVNLIRSHSTGVGRHLPARSCG